MTVVVTKELAVKTFEKVIEELGGDTIIDTCQIYEGFPGHKTPSCAVGQVYYRLVDESDWDGNTAQAWPKDGWTVEGGEPDYDWEFSAAVRADTAFGYLNRLQELQDSQLPWAVAHKIAVDPAMYVRWVDYDESPEDIVALSEAGVV